MRKIEALLKSNWFASDIADYYGCSLEKANSIKAKVEYEYGVIKADEHSQRKSVSADDVIKVMGGKDRLTELEIYKNYVQSNPKIIIKGEINGKEEIEPIVFER